MSDVPRRDRPARRLSGLERWLEEWAREEQATAGRLRQYVSVVVVAGMLDRVRDDAGRHRFVVKGGASLELRFGHRARASQDLDTVFRGELDEALTLVTEAVERGWEGLFSGRVVGLGRVDVPGLSVKPLRFKVKLAYLGKSFSTLPMEISAPEGRATDDYDTVAVRPLDPLGVRAPSEVPCLAVRYQIAQKLHACTDPMDGDRVNDRARDLADLILIEELAMHGSDLPEIRQACVEIFEGRERHPWPPAVQGFPGWEDLWARLVEEQGFPLAGFDQAVARVQALVDRIDALGRPQSR